MTLDEAWKKFGCKYAGPNLEEKFKQLMREYAQDKCKEMREMCAEEGRQFCFDNVETYGDYADEDDCYNFIKNVSIPDLE